MSDSVSNISFVVLLCVSTNIFLSEIRVLLRFLFPNRMHKNGIFVHFKSVDFNRFSSQISGNFRFGGFPESTDGENGAVMAEGGIQSAS